MSRTLYRNAKTGEPSYRVQPVHHVGLHDLAFAVAQEMQTEDLCEGVRPEDRGVVDLEPESYETRSDCLDRAREELRLHGEHGRDEASYDDVPDRIYARAEKHVRRLFPELIREDSP